MEPEQSETAYHCVPQNEGPLMAEGHNQTAPQDLTTTRTFREVDDHNASQSMEDDMSHDTSHDRSRDADRSHDSGIDSPHSSILDLDKSLTGRLCQEPGDEEIDVVDLE